MLLCVISFIIIIIIIIIIAILISNKFLCFLNS